MNYKFAMRRITFWMSLWGDIRERAQNAENFPFDFFPILHVLHLQTLSKRVWLVVSVTLLNDIEDVFWIFIHGLHLGQKNKSFSWKTAFQLACPYLCPLGGFITLICFQMASIFEKRMSFLGWKERLIVVKKRCFLVRAMGSCLYSRLENLFGKNSLYF